MLQHLLSYLGIGAAEIPEDWAAEIPEDLQIEILSRVPAKLVTRFRGLSKFHRTLIDSPYFIRRHDERTTNCNQIILYRQTQARDDMVMFDLTKFEAKGERLAIPLEKEHLYIVGCCAGILCLLQYRNRRQDSRILLWNPSTGSGRRINPGKYPIDRGTNYYFGHDEVTDDLKILKVWAGHGCEVYSCRDGCWRKYEIDWPAISPWNVLKTHRGVFVKGTSSVHVHNRSYNKPSIAAFDFASEKFNKIAVPPGCAEYETWAVSECQGKLCITSRKWKNWDMWVMKEYGVEESWSCLFSLHLPDLGAIKPLGFVNDGRQLAFSGKEFNSNKYSLRAYDLEKKKVIKNQMISSSVDYCYVEPFAYTPSIR